MPGALAWACLVASLLGPPRALGAAGERCSVWTRGEELPEETFRCPRWRDAVQKQFCCGSCRWAYCCASPKLRLDQRQCRPKEPSPEASALHQVLLAFASLGVGVLAFLVSYYGTRYFYYRFSKCLHSRNGPRQRTHSAPFDDPPPPYSESADAGSPSSAAGDGQQSSGLAAALGNNPPIVRFHRLNSGSLEEEVAILSSGQVPPRTSSAGPESLLRKQKM